MAWSFRDVTEHMQASSGLSMLQHDPFTMAGNFGLDTAVCQSRLERLLSRRLTVNQIEPRAVTESPGPGDQLLLVGMCGEAIKGMDARPYRQLLTQHLDPLSAIDQPLP